jgi:hypothetical protein
LDFGEIGITVGTHDVLHPLEYMGYSSHASSASPDAHDAISIHRLAPECFLVIFPMQQTRKAASTTSRTPPPATSVEADAYVEPVSFEAQLLPRPDTPTPY